MLTRHKHSAPQKSLLFRVIAFFSRLQFVYLYRSVKDPRILTSLFVFLSASTSLATIAIAAYLTDLPLLFPPLGPSAFILFYTPMSMSASPRNLILSHTMALAAGSVSLHLLAAAFPGADLFDRSTTDWHQILSVALAMGLITALMIGLKSSHPPAAASALIAAMGYLDDPLKIAGFLAAVLLLAMEGYFFNHILGGLPYPLWRADPKVVRDYGVLAGIPTSGEDFWGQLVSRTFRRR